MVKVGPHNCHSECNEESRLLQGDPSSANSRIQDEGAPSFRKLKFLYQYLISPIIFLCNVVKKSSTF